MLKRQHYYVFIVENLESAEKYREKNQCHHTDYYSGGMIGKSLLYILLQLLKHVCVYFFLKYTINILYAIKSYLTIF